MKRFLIGSIIAATMIAVSLPAQEIKKRQENQQDRIAQGAASGELTAAETARLETREAKLNHKSRKDRRWREGNVLHDSVEQTQSLRFSTSRVCPSLMFLK